MKALLDTNVLVDYLLSREKFSKSANTILKLSNAKFVELYVTDLTIADIAYITRKDITIDGFYRAMNALNEFYTIIPIGPLVIQKAFEAKWKDFEDALQSFAAEQAGIEYIITRNKKDFEKSTLTTLTPDEFIDKVSH